MTVKKSRKGFAATVFALAVALCLFGASALCAGSSKVAAEGGEALEEYVIYPVPHSVTYNTGKVTVSERVKVTFGDGIDVYTQKHTYDALARLDVLTGGGDGDTEVLIGVFGSGDAADTYVKSAVAGVSDAFFERFDAHIVHIADGHIAVLGKDTDAAFYGVTTLDAIFGQVRDRSVRSLTVKDYSDKKYRGFIEGYYGIPWTTEERIDLMRFGGKIKSNVYIYAPKNDAYHCIEWRDLYTGADLEALKEQITAGLETKTQLAYAIHPFLYSPFLSENYDRDLGDLLAKFEQLYGLGVRRFVVSADDVVVPPDGNIDVAVQTRLLNDVVAWLNDKGDCYELAFVPSAYCYQSETSLGGIVLEDYYAKLMPGLDESIEIMWTGNTIASSLSTGKFTEFTELTQGRKAFVWFNWTATDFLIGSYEAAQLGILPDDYIVMGKGEPLDVRTVDGASGFSGIVINPMQYPEMSKTCIFAVADYCWNIEGFDEDKSWRASFDYIDAGGASELAVICGNFTNAGLFEGKYFEESAQLKPYIDRFMSAEESGTGVREAAINLSNQLDIIVSAVDMYNVKATNQKFKADIAPWAESLKRLALASQGYLDCILRVMDGNASGLKEAFDAAEQMFESRRECKAPLYNYVTYNPDMRTVGVSISVFEPFADELRKIGYDDVTLFLGLPAGVTMRKGLDKLYAGSLENLVDGDPETFAWFEGIPPDGAFVRVDLGEVVSVERLRILGGKPNYDGDRFLGYGDIFRGYVELSEDGKNYVRVGDLTGIDSIMALRSAVRARYVRVVSSGNVVHAQWVALREIMVNDIGDINVVVTTDGILLEPSVVGNSLLNMTDDSADTFAWLVPNYEENASVTLDLLQVVQVKTIQLLMTKLDSTLDRFYGFKFSYSVDGESFTDIKSYEANLAVVREILDEPVDARYVRVTATGTYRQLGVVIRDFSVNKEYALSYDGYTENNWYRDPIGTYQYSSAYYATDGKADTFIDLLPSGASGASKTLTLDLKEDTAVNNINISSGGFAWGGGITSCKIELLDKSENIVKTLNEKSASGEYALALDAPITARYMRVTVLCDGGVSVREISVNDVGDRRPAVSIDGILLEPSVAGNSLSNMTDDSVDTFAWLVPNYEENASVTLDLLQVVQVKTIQLLMTKLDSTLDRFYGFKFSYSVDGENFTDIKSYEANLAVVRETLDEPVDARYVRVTATGAYRQLGVVIRDFSVNKKYALGYGGGYTENNWYRDPLGTYQYSSAYYATDGKADTFIDLLPSGASGASKTLTLDLEEDTAISKINISSGGFSWGGGITSCKIELLDKSENVVKTLNESSANGEYSVALDAPTKARYVRVTVLCDGGITVREISVK